MNSKMKRDGAIRMPPRSLLKDVLADSVCELRRGTWLARAAWTPSSVLPESVARTYRWGPPALLGRREASYPFHWVYVAEDLTTAVWEARFCRPSIRRPGYFHVERGAVAEGLVVRFRLEEELRLLDLGSTTAARLGIFDQVSNPHYTWCQHFGVELHHILAELHADTGAIGIRYPSRRLRNHSAIAIHSRHLGAWRRTVTVRTMRFGDMPFHRELCSDPCYLAPGR